MDFKDSVVLLSTLWMREASGTIALEFPGGKEAAPKVVPANTRVESKINRRIVESSQKAIRSALILQAIIVAQAERQVACSKSY